MANKECSVDECTSPTVGRGWCSKHWQRWKTHGTPTPAAPTLEDRFWAKVDKSGECWEWTGHRNREGYGRWRIPTGRGSNGKSSAAHRVSWEWVNGPIPEGMQIDHRCHNTSCVRPGHLRLTTPKQNQEHRIAANKGNPSGVRGVTRSGDGRYWLARVRHQGKNHNAGCFKTVEAAAAAVSALRQQLFTHSDMDRTAA